MNGVPIKLKVDEDDLFDDTLMFYKAVAFDPTRPLHISLLNQPALDTGGIRRQFFTDILDQFASRDPHSMFQGNKHRLRPAVLPETVIITDILECTLKSLYYCCLDLDRCLNIPKNCISA